MALLPCTDKKIIEDLANNLSKQGKINELVKLLYIASKLGYKWIFVPKDMSVKIE